MHWLTAGWVIPSERAARVKLPSSATALKTLSLLSSSIGGPPCYSAGAMAPIGQTSAQVPQSTQRSGLIT